MSFQRLMQFILWACLFYADEPGPGATPAEPEPPAGGEEPPAEPGATAAGEEPPAGDGEEGEPKSILEAIEKGLNVPPGEETPPPPEEPPPKTATPAEPEPGAAPPGPEPSEDLKALIQIPKGIKGDHRAAFKALADKSVELDRKLVETSQQVATLTEAKQMLDGFQEVITNSQAKPEQLAQAFDYLYHINNGNLDQAIELIEHERASLYALAGKLPPGTDALADHPDLQQKVEALELTREAAEEIARYRNTDKLRKSTEARAKEQSDQQRQQQAAYAEARKQGLAGTGRFLETMRVGDPARGIKPDPHFAYREQAVNKMVNDPQSQLHQTLRAASPLIWPQVIEYAYNSIQPPAPAAAPATPAPKGRDPQPLRPRSGGGGKPEPGNMQSAIEQGLGYSQ